MEIRPTAQLVVSDREATLAYALRKQSLGPSGESHVAVLLGTSDCGHTWRRNSLERTFSSRLRHWGFPTWPPEAVMELASGESGLELTFRDEWVPHEPGGIWQKGSLKSHTACWPRPESS